MAGQDGIRVCTTVVPIEGSGEVKDNARRIALYEALLAKAGDLLVLPAGYLALKDEAKRHAFIEPLCALAKTAGVAVAFGIDVVGRTKKGLLPSFMVTWSPSFPNQHLFRQRSRTRIDAAAMTDEAVRGNRIIVVKGHCVAPIVCGELFNARIRVGIAQCQPVCAIISAHTASGARHWAGQAALAKLNVASLRSVHAAGAARDVMATKKNDLEPLKTESFEGVTLSHYFVKARERTWAGMRIGSERATPRRRRTAG
jgi:hypothetical protein